MSILLSARLVRMIEDHSEDLTDAAVEDLLTNPKTPSYNALTRETIRQRVFEIYHNLGQWLTVLADERIETLHQRLARQRRQEGIPLKEMVYACFLIKYHLRDYIGASGLVNSAVGLYQEQELQHLIGSFFDKCVYFMVSGYDEVKPRLAAVEKQYAARV